MSRKIPARVREIEALLERVAFLTRYNEELRAALDELEQKRAGYDELLVTLDAAFAAGGCDDRTRQLLRLCAEEVGVVHPQPPTEWLMAMCRRIGIDQRMADDHELRRVVRGVLESTAPAIVAEQVHRLIGARNWLPVEIREDRIDALRYAMGLLR